jgi:hypothetical protein
MNEQYIQGIFEFYSIETYDTIEIIIKELGDRNFLNLTCHPQFTNNKGSIIIPFGKIFRLERDKSFLNDELNFLLPRFYPLDIFFFEFYIDATEGGLVRTTFFYNEGDIHIGYSKLPIGEDIDLRVDQSTHIDFFNHDFK